MNRCAEKLSVPGRAPGKSTVCKEGKCNSPMPECLYCHTGTRDLSCHEGKESSGRKKLTQFSATLVCNIILNSQRRGLKLSGGMLAYINNALVSFPRTEKTTGPKGKQAESISLPTSCFHVKSPHTFFSEVGFLALGISLCFPFFIRGALESRGLCGVFI